MSKRLKDCTSEFKSLYRSRFEPNLNPDDELQHHIEAILQGEIWLPEEVLSYDKLPGPACTRVVILMPGQPCDPIRCTLQQVDLENVNRIQYIALSYACGDQSKRLPITCDAGYISITVNLYSALLRLRDPQKELIMWADALSINQSWDPEPLRERAAQVQMMDKIFSGAMTVFVDLGGSSTKHHSLLVSALHRFDALDQDEFDDKISNGEFSKDMILFDHEHVFWSLYEDLLLRPWLRRVWCVQEFVLAKQVILMFGAVQIRPELLTNNLGKLWIQGEIIFSVLERDHQPIDENIKHLMHLAYLQEEYKAGTHINFTSILDMTHLLGATDNRDHLYALIGLMKDYQASEMPVSYTESQDALHLRLGRYLTQHGLAAYCLTRPGGLTGYGASWIPPLFNRRSEAGFLFMSHQEPHSEYFNACGSTDLQVQLSQDGQHLTVQALKIDVVDACCPPLQELLNASKLATSQCDVERGWIDKDLTIIMQWYLKAKRWAYQVCENTEADTFLDVFRRTAVADCFPIESAGGRTLGEEGRLSYTADYDGYFIAFEDVAERRGDADTKLSVEAKRVADGILQALCPAGKRSLAYGALRRLGYTTRKRMALVPEQARPGDEVWILCGIPVPFVLRRTGNAYLLVERCYVHGVMDGEAFEASGWKSECLHIR